MVDRKPSRQAFTIRLDDERYEWVRRQAYERRISMQRIIEEAVDVLRLAEIHGERAGARKPDGEG
jgi:predicted transcriptional regulator